MEQKENNNLETSILSEQEKNFAIYGIVFSTILILILITLIAEAYINQHPIFEFWQYAIFRPKMEFLGSISLSIMYIGVLLYTLAQCLFIIYNFPRKKILLILVISSFLLLLFSLYLLFIAYDWQLSYSVYGYIGFALLILGTIGRMTNITLRTRNYAESHKLASIIQKTPFQLLLVVGIIILFYFK